MSEQTVEPGDYPYGGLTPWAIKLWHPRPDSDVVDIECIGPRPRLNGQLIAGWEIASGGTIYMPNGAELQLRPEDRRWQHGDRVFDVEVTQEHVMAWPVLRIREVALTP